jgi:hypothetical protein
MKNIVIDRNLDYVITRNIKDFKESVIPAKTPEELIVLLNNEFINNAI